MRVGVVGTGYLGRLHARILTEIPEADVAGFFGARMRAQHECSTAQHGSHKSVHPPHYLE